MTVECSECGRHVDREGVEYVGDLVLCPECRPGSGDDGSEDEIVTPHDETGSAEGGDLEFANPESGVWPDELLEREQWMGHVEKKPFAPWGDHDHAEADDDTDARYKWGLTENYVDGETVAIAEDDPRLDGRVFLQQADDPNMYVDGDDVRDPDTGEVHPAFVEIIERLGASYADVSTSGAGGHVNYRGELPNGVKQAAFPIDDEPWGANDEIPSVEIYDGKRVCVMTGRHVPGTPIEVREADPDELEAILDEHDELPEERDERAREFDHFDPEDYEPDATGVGETTDDIRDIFAALRRIDARDVAGRTIVSRWNDDASTSDGKRAFYPTWGSFSDNGTANVVDEQIWQDTGDVGGYGGPVVMALIDAGELTPAEATPRVRGSQWWRGVEELREMGYPIPEYEGATADAEPVAVLPPRSPKARALRDGWDWTEDRSDADGIALDDARERTTEAIVKAIDYAKDRLVHALPTMGKSYGSIKAAAETGEPVTVFTNRGRDEQYQQYREWCDEHGLTHYTLPAFTHDCPTANGEHGQEWADRVRGWYHRGATPQEIHKSAEYVMGRPLPCQEKGDCPYATMWDFDPDGFDVLIGHYAHAHKSKVTKGRAAVFDEFPGDTYLTELKGRLPGAVSRFLQAHESIPFEDYTDLIEHRDDGERRGEALLWFEDREIEREEELVFDHDDAHADAPLAVYTLLASDDLGNGWERATTPDGRVGVFDREQNRIVLLSPPPFEYTRCVVALDGTPTLEMWRRALGVRVEHHRVLDDDERREYVRDALNYHVVKTTEWVKPYNSDQNVNVDADAALLNAIADEHGREPALITTRTAAREYRDAGVLDLTPDWELKGGAASALKWYGNLKGSNEFKTDRLGAVVGSNHYGDGFIKQWGALDGHAVERGDGKGADLTYGEFGNKVLNHMREYETLQATMRFGRDGNGAVIYVHTDTLPEWVPVAGEGRVVNTYGDGMKQVVEAASGREQWTAPELAEDVDVGARQVRNILADLAERGVIAREFDGQAYIYHDNGLHRIGEHGEVELDAVDIESVGEDTAAEISRNSIYTWNFRREAPATGAGASNGGDDRDAPAVDADRGDEQHGLGSFATANGGDRAANDVG